MKKISLFLVQTLMILSLFFCFACSKDDDNSGGVNKAPTCSITNPQNNAQFSMDESVTVTVVAEDTDGTIAEVQLYVDNVGHSLKTEFPYNFTINAGELAPGAHVLKAVAKDDKGAKGESTVNVTIKQPSTESPDFVSFSDGKIPNTWQTTAWVIDNTVGFDDIYSLKVAESGVALVTSKTFTVYSYVEFYTTGNNFYFYIDGVRVNSINTSNTGSWRQWVYAITPGTHTFKWESTSASKLNLDAIKFAPSDKPEIYTTDVSLPENSLVATVNYTLSSNGNHTITAYGICWSTTPNPTVANNKTINTGNTGSYMDIIENPVYNTTYYVRAYASNAVGTTYGEELNFKTANLEVYTIDVTQTPGNSITVNYTLSNNGNSLITGHGVCWSLSPNPTISGSKITNTGENIGGYTSIIENLNYNTTYYVRAYVSNAVATAYGEELSITTSLILVGDQYQGGFVAYIDATGKHGLIAAPNDQSAGIQWYNGSYIVTGATGTAIGTGQSNTAAIIAAQGEGSYAAKLCDDLVLNGYEDWFLPSRDELNLLYQRRNLIGGFNTENGVYWSSSESKYNNAWCQHFYSGSQYHYLYKDDTYRVRAVRAF